MGNASELNRNYAFLGTTQSLCPECLGVVPAKIIARDQRVYFRKNCPTHGLREDFICSDRSWYDRYDYALPPKLPTQTFVEPKKGCPLDCGLCSEHEQHTCIAVLEITDNCNLTCPMCYANSKPGLQHKSLKQIQAAIDALVLAEGQPDVLQISGGEPTTHPGFFEVMEYALKQPIDYIMVNTNGIRAAKDRKFVEQLAQNKDRVEIYLQMDGVTDATHRAMRGEPLQEIKLRAIEQLGAAGLHITLVATMQTGVNENELGGLLELAMSRPWITGLSIQPATYSGRYHLPEELEQRITAPDCVRWLCEQSHDMYLQDDFFPLPCAHPNCHILALAYRKEGRFVPLTRFMEAKLNLDLLANGLSFTREESNRLMKLYLARNNGCAPNCDCTTHVTSQPIGPKSLPIASIADEFIERVIQQQIGGENLFRITITSFLDAYNFDVRRVMKCCTHHVLPTGHIIPFCAYNVLYRNGHVALPEIVKPEIVRG